MKRESGSEVKMPDAREFANRLCLVLDDRQVDLVEQAYLEFQKETVLASAEIVGHEYDWNRKTHKRDCGACELERLAASLGEPGK